MDHKEALREKYVEKYLLGELTGDSRNGFEEHLFECRDCTTDLKSGMSFLEGLRAEVAAEPVRVAERERTPFLQWLLNPVWLAPAFAACLGVVVYQNVVAVPHMRQELAQANAPAVMNTLVLAGGETRGGEALKIVAPEGGSFLLSVDIPPTGDYAGYGVTLMSPAGTAVWHGEISPAQAKDSVQIRVPVAVTAAGENTLVVQGERQSGGTDVLSTHKFVLEVHR